MKKSLALFMFIVLIAGMAFVSGASATTINATSCSQSDVQFAINSASNGDTVVIPAGQCTWAATVKIAGKGITLQGAGVTNTIITDATPNTAESSGVLIDARGAYFTRITGIRFKGSDAQGAIMIKGGGANKFRVDHCQFGDSCSRGVAVREDTYGVIDHNTFVDCGHGVDVIGKNDISWETPLSLGTERAVYVEDNTFQNTARQDGAFEAYGGARYVFRYNTVFNTDVEHHGFDSGGFRSTLSWEIYNNTGSLTILPSLFTFFNARGGTGVVFNNTLTGNYGDKLRLVYYRSACGDGFDCSTYIPPANQRCNGSSSADGNEDSTGYPCKDQPGRGPNQVRAPAYAWNNTFNGVAARFKVPLGGGNTGPSFADHIKENRDYYNCSSLEDARSKGLNYTPYTYPHPLTLASPGPAPVPAPALVPPPPPAPAPDVVEPPPVTKSWWRRLLRR